MKLKKALLSVVACVLSLVLVFAVTACNEESAPVVTALTLDKTETSLATGSSVRLTASAVYDNDETKTLSTNEEGLSWTSEDPTVASVTKGVVYGVGKGTTSITASYGEFTATCSVTVYALEIQISKTAVTIEKNTTEQLTAKVLLDGVEQTDSEIEWESSDYNIATVDGSGLVTALMEGNATVTAKLKGGTQKAECAVTVNWSNRPASYKAIGNTEQNKAQPNTWGYWNDQGWNWSTSTMYEAYTEDYAEGNATGGYEYIGAQKATFDFEIATPGTPAIIQCIYRSAGEEGKLLTNHNYEVELKLESNVAGAITLNTYGDVGSREDYASEEEYQAALESFENRFEIVKGVNTIKATFRHGDYGSIYKSGIYDNVESAIHLLLGELEGRVIVSVYDIKYKDLGESTYKVTEDASKLEGAVEPSVIPDFSNVDSVALDIINDDDHKDQAQVGNDKGTYTVTASTDKKSYDIQYTTKTSTYEFFKVDLSGVETANYNTFAVTLTNNGTSDVAIRFDLNGATATQDPNGSMTIVDCVISNGIATGGSVSWDSSWGGTVFTVGAGATETIYLNYACDVHGAPEELAIYCNTQWYGNESSNWGEIREERTGNITLSDFKFGTVALPEPEPTHPADPAVKPVSATTVTGVTLTVENEKAIYNLAGTVDLAQYDNSVETAETWLASTHFDLQQCGGNWTNYAFNRVDVTVNADGTFVIKYDITYLSVDAGGTGAYTSHFTEKETSEGGYNDNHYRDVKLDENAAIPGESVTVGGKKYSIVNIVGGTTQEDNWGCVSIKVELA